MLLPPPVVARWSVLVVLLAAVVGAPSRADEPPAVAPKPNITISKQTTRVTGPLRADGYVDYAGAVNARFGKGVTAENNANVLFWQAIGPHPDGASVAVEFFRMMGIDPPAEKGDYFVDIGRYLREAAGFKEEEPRFQDVIEQQERAQSQPWTAAEYPLVAQWLKANAKPLAQIVEGTGRPKYYAPLVIPQNGAPSADDTLASVLLPALGPARGLARALAARALLRAGQGRTAEAWRDLQACHRLGRLVGSGPTLIEMLVAIAIDAIAAQGDLVFFEQTQPDRQQAARYQTDLAALPGLPEVAEKVDVGERFMYLDATQMLARGNGSGFSQLSGGGSSIERLFSWLTARAVDWDTVLVTGNGWYDRLVAALRIADRNKRRQALEQLDVELKQLVASTTGFQQILRVLLGSRKAVGESMANILVGLMLPATVAARTAQERARQTVRQLPVAVALAAYRRAHGGYPETLSQLAPDFLKAIPGDLFSGRELIYKRSPDGYLLYSVGANERDEGGRSHGDDRAGDDLTVRAPPHRQVIPRRHDRSALRRSESSAKRP